MRRSLYQVLSILLLMLFAGCGHVIKKQERSSLAAPELHSKEEAELLLEETGKDIVYGPTIGKATASIVGMILFPPYGIYQLGKLGAGALGYDVDPTAVLPEEPRQFVNSTYSAITSVPGRALSLAGGEEFREEPQAARRLEETRNRKAWEQTEDYFSDSNL